MLEYSKAFYHTKWSTVLEINIGFSMWTKSEKSFGFEVWRYNILHKNEITIKWSTNFLHSETNMLITAEMVYFIQRKFTYQNLILDIFQNSGYNLVSVPVCYSHLHVYCMLRRVNTSLFMNSKSLLLCVVSHASSVKWNQLCFQIPFIFSCLHISLDQLKYLGIIFNPSWL